MDQSRPRHPTLIAPLIERADLQSARQRMLYGAVSLFFWAFWFYLWLPLLALMAWSLGLEQAYKYMIVLEGYRELFRLLGWYSMVILCLGGGLLAWAGYNIFRFSGFERRCNALDVTVQQMARNFALDPDQIAKWQQARQLYAMHDGNGRVSHVVVASAVMAGISERDSMNSIP